MLQASDFVDRENAKVFQYVKIPEGGTDDDAGERAFIVLNFSDEEQSYHVPTEAGGSQAKVLLQTQEDGVEGKRGATATIMVHLSILSLGCRSLANLGEFSLTNS